MENFVKGIEELSKRINTLKEQVNTEEATKTALILPFFQKLGYDIFNPMEFTPEYIADVGIKKGEKVDYAIMNDNQPTILIECKSVNEKLSNHDSQLFRYYGTSKSKFGILTNGIEYRFFTDLEETNKMDSKPFLVFDILNLKENHIKEIYKFSKEMFDIDNISSSAYELKYVNLIKNFLNQELENPSDEFVKFVLTSVYDGVKTKTIIDRFTPTLKNTFNLMINEKVTDKLNAALNNSTENKVEVKNVENLTKVTKTEDLIVTTPEELESYAIIKVISSDTIDTQRVHYRDNRSYFNILIDNSIRKWLTRIYFTKNRNYIILNDDHKTTLEFNEPIDLLKYKDEISKVIEKFI
ncbi:MULTISPECIES: type I restriction endonuclease [Mammaliicoccus]|uniref:type I restriction endonuclease n=1 Tax=Mammaliicoccus TaxID=2803850 RepID=UPI000E031F37|nr:MULTISPECIES: type I restriction endonuclease [Mammaliicoccus]HCN59600.1 endonuclease [Staphylococcus sp.]MEB7723365.1 type I restriction enzyme HsdR N-terminal domain-containing protein [Mammaliicoccus fleurettii]MEB7780112.1 type I restriction enzyme HsdR N-terminal domain-containing protein [Mammaliicoccus fleurettii]MEB7805570.1 type I restriction enzyme HsdR N-terminal domain-containing protein [Mammaliicoccus fleurettii]RTX84545.1 endonuclease [Mammaliicoccus fleurettii]